MFFNQAQTNAAVAKFAIDSFLLSHDKIAKDEQLAVNCAIAATLGDAESCESFAEMLKETAYHMPDIIEHLQKKGDVISAYATNTNGYEFCHKLDLVLATLLPTSLLFSKLLIDAKAKYEALDDYEALEELRKDN